MLIDDNIRKCVQFLQYQSGTGIALAGTAFLVHFRDENAEDFGYLITAKHVIEAIRRKGCDGQAYVRVNTIAGSFETVGTKVRNWLFHPTDQSADVAAIPWPGEERFDQLGYPLPRSAATPEVMAKLGLGVGDEIFLAGLFHFHHGKKRNIPIIRFGNIAAMPEEAVELKEGPSMEAFLVEMRSISGLSGSPVFVPLLGRARGQKSFYLLGLMHGHWNIDSAEIAATDSGEPLNTGIGIVVPVTKILETLNQERFGRQREEETLRRKSKNGPTPD